MRILVTGSSGFVGQSLLARLRQRCNEVIVCVRGRPSCGDMEFQGPDDFTLFRDWPDWPPAIDVVIHLAALNPSRTEDRLFDRDELHRVNVAGTAALTNRARREGVKRVIFVSTANVHSSVGSVVSEADTLQPRSAYAASKKDAESAFWESLAGGETEGCILRPAPVYGPRGRGNLTSLLRVAKLPLPLPLDGLGGPRSLLAVDHLVEVIELCGVANAAAWKTFLVADQGPLSLAEIVRALRMGWGKMPLIIPAPTRLLESCARAMGKGEVWLRLTQPFIVDTRKIEGVLGWRSPVNSQQKLKEMAAADLL